MNPVLDMQVPDSVAATQPAIPRAVSAINKISSVVGGSQRFTRKTMEQFFDVFRSFAIDAVFVFMEKHHACFCCAGHQHLHAPEGLIPPTVHAFGCWRIKAKYADVFCAKNAAQFDRALESLQVRFKWIIRGDLANGGTNGTQSHPTRLQKTEERIDLLSGQIQHIRFMDRPQFNISDPASRQHVELLDGIGRYFIGESTDGETCHDCILRVGLAVC